MGGAVAPLSAEALRARKGGRRIAMLTAYDHPTARALDGCGLDVILVGDSLGEVELGYGSTRSVTLGMMTHHVRAVRNGVTATHVCADLPAGTYEDPPAAVAAAAALTRAGADSVKLEGALIPQVRAIIEAGTPVMGHVGLLPQTAETYVRRGRDPEDAERIAADARALDAAGCYAVVIEAVPSDLSARVTAEISCPTIGIAAGSGCDGQVLVSADLIGQTPDPPAFVRPRADVHGEVVRAAREFADEVRGAA